jgi:uncharacterized membrane protein
MRKILEGISVVGLIVLVLDTFFALYGPYPVHDKVPSHFDMAGHADRFSDLSSLQDLPLAALVVYLLLTFIAVYPSLAEHLSAEAQRIPSPMEVAVTGLVTWIKTEAVWLFAIFQMALIQAARNPGVPVSLVWIWILVGAVAATIVWHVISILRARRFRSEAAVTAPEPEETEAYSFENPPQHAEREWNK